MNIIDRVGGWIYDVSELTHAQLLQGELRRGRGWLNRELHRLWERGDAIRVEQVPIVRQELDEALFAQEDLKLAVKKKKEVKQEVLEFPIVPEADEEGNKRLYKTRYAILEKKYADLHNKYNRTLRDIDEWAAAHSESQSRLQKSEREVQELRLQTIDSDKVMNRVNKIAQEIKLEMPFTHPYTPLSEKLETFLGAIFCRLRTIEEDQDELAD